MAWDDFRLYFYCFTNVWTQGVSQVFTIISNPWTPRNQFFFWTSEACSQTPVSSGPTGSPWRLNPASPLLVSGENTSGFSEGIRNKKRETGKKKKKEENRGAVQPFGESVLVIEWLFSQVPGPSTLIAKAPEDDPFPTPWTQAVWTRHTKYYKP